MGLPPLLCGGPLGKWGLQHLEPCKGFKSLPLTLAQIAPVLRDNDVPDGVGRKDLSGSWKEAGTPQGLEP